MTPLVLVHGFMGGGDQWASQDALAASRALVRVDLPGFGGNAHLAPVDSIAGFSHWVLGELTRRGIAQFDLLGHSMGGMVVQEMIRVAPERVNRLVLYATAALGRLPGRFETIETSMQRAEADGARATARRISATWFRDGADAAQYPACAAIAERSSLRAILAGLTAMRDWSGMTSLAQIAVPTLVVWGDQDRTYAWPQIETLWSSVPNASLAVVPGCAHAVHMEAPDIFNRVVKRWLEDV